MFRKQPYIDQEEYYELQSGTPFRQNLCQAVTPRKSYRYEPVWSGSQFNQSSMRQSRSMLRQSNRKNNDSSKITKVNNYVVAFDELLGEQKEYSFRQQRALPTTNVELSNKAELNDESFCASLSNIHQQMVTLDQTINDLESKMQEIKIKQLNFLNVNEEIKQEKYVANNTNELRLFNQTKDNQKIMELGKPEDFEKLQIVYIQQNISGMVGRLSHLLQTQNQVKMGYKSTDIDLGSETSFTFNKNLNRFTKIYKCKFCDLKFIKACSLGGHISRTHKEESLQFKKDSIPIKKTSIVKQKKAALLKSITQALE